jgi:hypothetical protein
MGQVYATSSYIFPNTNIRYIVSLSLYISSSSFICLSIYLFFKVIPTVQTVRTLPLEQQ